MSGEIEDNLTPSVAVQVNKALSLTRTYMVWVELCPSKSYVKVLTPSMYEGNLFGNRV